MQLETSHTQALVGKYRANPFYSSERVKDNVFAVAYAALASVQGSFPMKNDTSHGISLRLSLDELG